MHVRVKAPDLPGAILKSLSPETSSSIREALLNTAIEPEMGQRACFTSGDDNSSLIISDHCSACNASRAHTQQLQTAWLCVTGPSLQQVQ